MTPIPMAVLQRVATGQSAIGSDIYLIYGLACASHAEVMVEIGCRWGASTCAMLCAIDILGSGKLFCIDIDKKCRRFFSKHPSRQFVLSSSCDEKLPAELGITEIDLLFLDSSHKREQTEIELPIWLSLLSHHGVALIHDVKMMPEGVREPLMEYLERNGGVKTEEKDGVWLYNEYLETKMGLGVLRRNI